MVTPTYTVVLLLLWKEVSCTSETSCHLTARHGVQTWRTALFADANVTLSSCSGEERRVPVKPGKNSTSMQRRVRDKTQTSRFRVVPEREKCLVPAGKTLGSWCPESVPGGMHASCRQHHESHAEHDDFAKYTCFGSIKKTDYTSRPVRIIHAQGPIKLLCIISSHRTSTTILLDLCVSFMHRRQSAFVQQPRDELGTHR